MRRPQPSPSTPSLPEWMGLEVLDDRDGASMVRLRPRPEAHNYRGVVHGGSLATLADVAMGVAANSALGDDAWCITQALELHYLRPGRGELVAQARTIHRGRSSRTADAPHSSCWLDQAVKKLNARLKRSCTGAGCDRT